MKKKKIDGCCTLLNTWGIGWLVGHILFAINSNLGTSCIITVWHFIYASTDGLHVNVINSHIKREEKVKFV